MCFSPKISLSTAIVEFLVVLYFAFFYKKNFLIKLLIFFIFCLGFYQFSEFAVCTFDNLKLWASAAFLSYNFLPALGLHFVIRYSKIKFPAVILYIPTLIFASMVFWFPNFISSAECLELFVSVKTIFFRDVSSHYLTWIYWLYYFGYILIALGVSFYYALNEPAKGRRRSFLVIILSTLLSLVPAYIFIIIFPSYYVMFPSVYCEFSLVFALVALIGVRRSKEFVKK